MSNKNKKTADQYYYDISLVDDVLYMVKKSFFDKNGFLDPKETRPPALPDSYEDIANAVFSLPANMTNEDVKTQLDSLGFTENSRICVVVDGAKELNNDLNTTDTVADDVVYHIEMMNDSLINIDNSLAQLVSSIKDFIKSTTVSSPQSTMALIEPSVAAKSLGDLPTYGPHDVYVVYYDTEYEGDIYEASFTSLDKAKLWVSEQYTKTKKFMWTLSGEGCWISPKCDYSIKMETLDSALDVANKAKENTREG